MDKVPIYLYYWHVLKAWHLHCRNLNLELTTKARACKGVGQKGSPKCGRMWEWTFTLPSELPFWELES
jgi:hypothetical protein